MKGCFECLVMVMMGMIAMIVCLVMIVSKWVVMFLSLNKSITVKNNMMYIERAHAKNILILFFLIVIITHNGIHNLIPFHLTSKTKTTTTLAQTKP